MRLDAKRFGRISSFKGYGSRKNRVHVFDRATGMYLTCGFVKDDVLFVKEDIDLSKITIQRSQGRWPRSGSLKG